MDSRPIGLTGAIAGGKSTVLAYLAELGLKVGSSDEIAREVFALPEVQSALVRRLESDGSIAPARLREAMLVDPGLRRWTNRLMHPLVGERVARLRVDVVEVPLLFEACVQDRYREVWVVACGPGERKRRLQARYGIDADVDAYTRWQLTENAKVALGDVIVRTDRPLEDVHRFLREETMRCFPDRLARPE